MKPPAWITYGQTESGDALPVLIWWGCHHPEPSPEEVDRAYRLRLPEEYIYVGAVHWVLGRGDHMPPVSRMRRGKKTDHNSTACL